MSDKTQIFFEFLKCIIGVMFIISVFQCGKRIENTEKDHIAYCYAKLQDIRCLR